MRAGAIAIAIALGLMAGCVPPPKQAGGLEFFDHQGLERRMRILCRLGAGDDNIRAACLAPKVQPSVIATVEPADVDPPEPTGSTLAKECDPASQSCPSPSEEGTLEPEGRLTQ